MRLVFRGTSRRRREQHCAANNCATNNYKTMVLFVVSTAVASATVMPRRVLCLQGKGGDGAGMHARLERLRTVMGSDWQFDCLDAPHQIGGGDRAWWINPPGERSYTALSYEGDDLSIGQVEDAWSQGSYDALLGFSQGAMLAAVVGARGRLGRGSVRPRAMVLLGAALPKPHESLLEELSCLEATSFVSMATGLTSASLHCLSKADAINPPELGEWVADCFAKSSLEGAVQKLWHDSGHVIPGDKGKADQLTVNTIASFLDAFAR